MKTYHVTLDETRCTGCGYCVHFCPRACLQINIDHISNGGFALPSVSNGGKCNACGTCVRMCPHWALQVQSSTGGRTKTSIVQHLLTGEPPLAGCAGCQHPIVGRIIGEAVEELGCNDRISAFEGIPCSISSVFGTDFGQKTAHDENVLDLASAAKRHNPGAMVVAVAGYWGQADFSFDISSFVKTLIRGENLTVILCNTSFYGPRDQRPVPAGEPIEGQLEPITQIGPSGGRHIVREGHPLHLAELAATFAGVTYSARGTVSSLKDYHLTKNLIKTACQKQLDSLGLSFVEVLCICCDGAYSSPLESLKWINDKMVPQFPLGEFKNILP